ncbi:MAG: pyridoxal phosphate-dependent aminotransferase [Clostridia bacterium]|nr:pyridoxal phosphate-dependent aminotransferase [Clostridia bacterium]
MKYDFDQMPDRSGTASLKWDRNFRMGPVRYKGKVNSMWVADMDFPCAQPIVSAIEKRAAHPVYGYSFYDKKKVPGAICKWLRDRYNWELAYNDVFYAPGVVTSIGVLIREFTEIGDGIIIQTPVYYPFKKAIEAAGRRVIENPLLNIEGIYKMDFDDLVKKASDPDTKMMILCSPHNPVGRVWSSEELSKLSGICRNNGVLLLTDEIHMDLTRSHITFVPAATAGDRMNTITLTAPSKTFNIPGLSISATIIENPEFKERWQNMAYKSMGLGLSNPFGAEAFIAAYEQGSEWLSQVSKYIDENFIRLKGSLNEEIPEIGFRVPEGTYLAWLDLNKAGISDDIEFAEKLERMEGLLVDPGSIFGDEGRGFIRLNAACSTKRVLDAVHSIKHVLSEY